MPGESRRRKQKEGGRRRVVLAGIGRQRHKPAVRPTLVRRQPVRLEQNVSQEALEEERRRAGGTPDVGTSRAMSVVRAVSLQGVSARRPR